MLIDRYSPDDVFARVPELAEQADPVLAQLDHLLDDDLLFQRVCRDLARQYPLRSCCGYLARGRSHCASMSTRAGMSASDQAAVPRFFRRTSSPIPLVAISPPPKALAAASRANRFFV